jgi:SIR2-like domain
MSNQTAAATPGKPRSTASLAEHFAEVARKMLKGMVVPLLGSGVNQWSAERAFEARERLPSGSELAEHLVEAFPYKTQLEAERVRDLTRVAQFIYVMVGSGELYDALHSVFDLDYPPGPVHRFLAELQPILREHEKELQVILTTNYDDALEQAFTEVGEPYDLVTYVCASPRDKRGRFLHLPPGAADSVAIDTPNEYAGFDLSRRAVILKMHGAVARNGTFDQDNYVITEDDYIDYLANTDLSRVLPASIMRRLRRSSFLFLGYGMADWNLRVILRRIWGEQPLDFPSWSIQRDPRPVETKAWKDRGVQTFDLDLTHYVRRLSVAVRAHLQ